MKKILCFSVSVILVIATLLCIVIPVCNAEEKDDGESIISAVTRIDDGGEYFFVMGGITPTNMPNGAYVLKNFTKPGNSGGLKDVMAFAAYSPSDEITADILWKAEKYGEGFALRSCSVPEGEKNAYLNIYSDGNAKLGEKCELTLKLSDGKFTIQKNIGGTVYNLRFTNGASSTNVPGFQSGTATSSSTFTAYTVKIEYPLTDLSDHLVLSFACISDLHIDYGIQNYDTPMRQSLINTTSEIKKENMDLILFAGDLTSTNASNILWTTETYNKTISLFRKYTSEATKNGYVIYADGNHEFQSGYGDYDSGDFSKIMTEDIGKFDDAYYDSDGHLIGFHYVIKGFDFIGFNTSWKHTSGYMYTEDGMNWLESMMEKIGKDKTVFLVMHFPFNDSNGISKTSYGMNSATQTRMKAIFKKYPNAVIFYGHDHGGANAYVDSKTSQRITTYDKNGNPGLTNRPEGFVTAFSGSMAFYNNKFDGNKSLTSAECAVVQSLFVYVYDDHITFKMKNFGSESGSSYEIAEYSVYRTSTQIRSDVYSCVGGIGTIENGTKLSDIRKALDYAYELKFVGAGGKTIENENVAAQAGMTAVLYSGDTVIQTLPLMMSSPTTRPAVTTSAEEDTTTANIEETTTESFIEEETTYDYEEISTSSGIEDITSAFIEETTTYSSIEEETTYDYEEISTAKYSESGSESSNQSASGAIDSENETDKDKGKDDNRDQNPSGCGSVITSFSAVVIVSLASIAGLALSKYGKNKK